MVGAPRNAPSAARGARREPPADSGPEAPIAAGIDDAPESRARVKSVLVALHGRRAHSGAIELGRLIARALGAPLHGLFVGPEPIEASEVPAHVGVAPEALRGVVLDVAVSPEPGDALRSATENGQTAFVVIASDPEEARDESLGIGALAARALHSAVCGVVVLGQAARAPRIRRILLPLDGTPSTAAAIEPVGVLARTLDAELDIVMVGGTSPRGDEAQEATPPVSTPAAAEPGTMVPPLYVDQPQHEWPAFTEEFLDRFLNAIGHCPEAVSARFFLGAGEPAAEILRFAEELESDLVVLVWHGQLDGHHGGIFRDVLCNSTRPVLVLRR